MTPYFKEQLGCEGSMSQHDTLTLEPLQAGSASLLDGCKSIMDSIAVSSSVIEHNKQEPVQGAPAEHWHRLYLEKCQQYNDRVAQLGGVIEGLEAEAAQGAGEVVAWQERQTKDATGAFGKWYGCTAPSRLALMTDGYLSLTTGGITYQWRPLYTQPAAGADVWQPMSTAPSQKTVLLAVRNEYGRIRTVLARHVTRYAEEAGEDDQATEYRESDDTHYVTPGWYESNTEAEINYGITGEFLGWMNAPKWVDAAIAASGRQE